MGNSWIKKQFAPIFFKFTDIEMGLKTTFTYVGNQKYRQHFEKD